MLVAESNRKWILASLSLRRAIAPGVTLVHIVGPSDEDALQLFPVISTGMLVDALVVAAILDRLIVFSPVPENDRYLNESGVYVEEGVNEMGPSPASVMVGSASKLGDSVAAVTCTADAHVLLVIDSVPVNE